MLSAALWLLAVSIRALPRGTNNFNSNFNGYSPTQGSPIAMGLTAYQGSGSADTPGFKLTDVPNSGSVTNGGATVGVPTPSLLFSYATFSSGIYTLTSSATNIVVFGFNDNGSTDDNHDDFVGIRSEEHTSELQSRQYLVCR